MIVAADRRDATESVATREETCGWCGSPLTIVRRWQRFCSKKCRQASWRFRVVPAEASRVSSRPMVFAYADPPYPGKARYYPEKTEVDHASLIVRLTTQYPDGWALSTSSGALRRVLSLCPDGVRICVWFRGPRRTKSYRTLTSWEPLIVHGGRPLATDRVQLECDGLIYQGRYRAFPGYMIGAKPPQFSEWMFRQLGATHGDSLDDLFPGSGAVSVAWARFTGSVAAGSSRRCESLAPAEATEVAA
jgi:hypothetical protein